MEGAKLPASCGGNKEFTLFAVSVCKFPVCLPLQISKSLTKNYFHFIPFFCFFGEKMHPKQCGHKQCSWESAMENWVNRRSEEEEEGRNGCDARTRQLCPSYFWAQTEQQLAGMCPCLWSHRTAFAIYSQTQAQRFYISYHAENYLPLCLFQVSKHWLVNLNY